MTAINKIREIFNQNNSAMALNHAEMREDSAHQREVADLKAAGLNPILSAISGGSSSAASVAYVDSPADTKNANSAERNSYTNLINSISNLFSSAAKVR